MEQRIRRADLLPLVKTADEAAALIEDGMTVAVSGFSPSGNPKAVPLALAEQVRSGVRPLRIDLLSGASTGDEIDSRMGELGIFTRRIPYINSTPLRAVVNGKGPAPTAYIDQHLGMMAQNTRYGFYGHIDVAVIEAVAITEDGNIIPSTAVGCSQTFIDLADRVIVEINTLQPAGLEGFHDIYRMEDPPHRQPIPLTDIRQRIGRPYLTCPAEKLAAIVLTDVKENPRALAAPDEVSQRIAGHIVDFLRAEKAAGRLTAGVVPLQSGVGSVANAVLEGLKDAGFEHMTFYSEVIQDGVIDLIDAGKADFASGTSLSLSDDGMKRLLGNLEAYRDKLILRDSEISNSAEVIRRLGVIAMNTAIEADIYGNVNSSHISGTNIYNGIGGSGDFARNAAVTIFITNSTAKGGRISSIVPMVTHCDHNEHDVDVLVTEQGYADLRGLSPKERARLIIERCAHPDYQPLLWDYLVQARLATGGAQTPHLLDQCFSFHRRFADTGTMRPIMPTRITED